MSGKRIYCDCPYNVGIECEKMICHKGGECGWHPATEKKRKQKIKNGDFSTLRVPAPIRKPAAPRRERSGYRAERREKLRSEGKCTICGKENDRPDKWCCSACYERKRALEKARSETIIY